MNFHSTALTWVVSPQNLPGFIAGKEQGSWVLLKHFGVQQPHPSWFQHHSLLVSTLWDGSMRYKNGENAP